MTWNVVCRISERRERAWQLVTYIAGDENKGSMTALLMLSCNTVCSVFDSVTGNYVLRWWLIVNSGVKDPHTSQLFVFLCDRHYGSDRSSVLHLHMLRWQSVVSTSDSSNKCACYVSAETPVQHSVWTDIIAICDTVHGQVQDSGWSVAAETAGLRSSRRTANGKYNCFCVCIGCWLPHSAPCSCCIDVV